MKKPLLIGIDRDGTINLDDGHFGRKENWREVFGFQQHAVDGLKVLREIAGNLGRLFVATNQPGVAMGYFSCEKVQEINNYIDKELREKGVSIDNWQFCPYVTREYAREKELVPTSIWIGDGDLRKPGIGMVRKACQAMKIKLEDYDFYFIGDRKGDVQTGLNAGGIGCLVLTGAGRESKREVMDLHNQYPWRILIGDNLLSVAAEICLRREKQ